MLSTFARRLGATSLLLLSLVGATAISAPQAGAVVSRHTSGPQATLEGFAMCDVSPYAIPGRWMVQYLFTTVGVADGYTLSVAVSGFSPQTAFVGTSQSTYGANEGGYVTQYQVPGGTSQTSATLRFVWSGPGLPTISQTSTAVVPLSGSCATAIPSTWPVAGIAPTPDGKGYWLAHTNGQVTTIGDAVSYGQLGGLLNQPIVGIASTRDGKGYWLDAADGGIFAFGDAVFYGSMGGQHLNQPMVGMAATPDGKGYWTVAADGGIFSYGDARFYGSTGSMTLNQPVVGMASVGASGYYLVARDGGIFSFGTAPFYGSMGNHVLNRAIVGMSVDPNGGYREVAGDGGVFSFGAASFYGSTGGVPLELSIVGMANTPTGKGYWFVSSDGEVFGFGDTGNHS